MQKPRSPKKRPTRQKLRRKKLTERLEKQPLPLPKLLLLSTP
jgi:hypothetical protein